MAQNKLRLYFLINAVMIIVAFAFAILFVLFGGMALMATLLHQHAAATL